MVGKYLNGYANKPAVPPGWSEWYAASSGLQSETNSQKVYDYKLNENGTVVPYGHRPADFKQDVLTRKAVSFVNRRAPAPQPFFLWLTYTAPHAGGPDPSPQPPFDCGEAPKPAPRHAHFFDAEPLPRPPNFNEADISDKPAHIRDLPRLTPGRITDRQRIYRCELESLLSVDDGVKKVVDALRSRDELANTLLVFTSDNGFEQGEHRIFQGKQRVYEESIRVPLLMRGPGIPGGTTVGDPVINADLAPTIANVAGANAGLTMDGRSLMPIVRQPGTAAGRELLIETSAYQDRPSFAAVRTARYLYAEHSSGERELYDLQHDPFELVNRDRDPAYASAKAQLATRLLQLRTCAGASCRTRP
jgi:arylsulfatase A-like enzyme